MFLALISRLFLLFFYKIISAGVTRVDSSTLSA